MKVGRELSAVNCVASEIYAEQTKVCISSHYNPTDLNVTQQLTVLLTGINSDN
jgi:hypothetical protein